METVRNHSLHASLPGNQPAPCSSSNVSSMKKKIYGLWQTVVQSLFDCHDEQVVINTLQDLRLLHSNIVKHRTIPSRAIVNKRPDRLLCRHKAKVILKSVRQLRRKRTKFTASAKTADKIVVCVKTSDGVPVEKNCVIGLGAELADKDGAEIRNLVQVQVPSKVVLENANKFMTAETVSESKSTPTGKLFEDYIYVQNVSFLIVRWNLIQELFFLSGIDFFKIFL